MTQIITHLESIESSANQLQQTTSDRIRIIQGERDVYQGHSEKLALKLAQLDAKVFGLYQKLSLPIPISIAAELSSPNSSSPLSASSLTSRSPSPEPKNSSEKLTNRLSHIETTLNETQLTDEARVQIAQQERDKFYELFETLLGLVQSRRSTITELEKQVEAASAPKPVPAAAAASLTPKQKVVNSRELALRALVEDMDQVQGTIELAQRDKVLHNLIFIKYCELKKEKNEKVNLDSLSEKDPDLQEAALAAVQQVDPSYNAFGIIKSFIEKKTEIVKHIKSQIQNKENTVKDYGSATSITQLIGHAVDTVFAHYDAMYKYHSQQTSLTREMTYRDFPFREFPLFAGELFLLKTRLQQLDNLCEKIPPRFADHAKSIRLRATIASHIKNINTLEESYSRLLKRCRVKKF